MVDNDLEPPEVEDFGIWDADEDHLLETGQVFMQHHIMPKAGGWDDQDVAWRADMMIFFALYSRAQWEYYEAKREEGEGAEAKAAKQLRQENTPPEDWRKSLVQHRG